MHTVPLKGDFILTLSVLSQPTYKAGRRTDIDFEHKRLRLENTFIIYAATMQTIEGRHRIVGDQHEHVAGGDSAPHQARQDLQWNGARNLSHPSGRQRIHFQVGLFMVLVPS